MYSNYDPSSTYRILGIDPGTNTLGVCMIDVDLVAQSMTVAMARTFSGTTMSSGYTHFAEVHGERAARLKAHEDNLYCIMREWLPHSVISEDAYMGRFPTAYRALCECIDSIRVSLYRYNPALPLILVDPTTVKKGTGMKVIRKAGKAAVAKALSELEYLRYAQNVRLATMDEHSVDAVAVAHYRACQLIECIKGGLQWLPT
jgi:Holliday junction resolvasome RuvABC endonuclease subunit